MALSPITIDSTKLELVKLQGDLTAKNTLITTLTTEKSQLLLEKQSLADDLTAARTLLASTQNKLAATENSLNSQITTLQGSLATVTGQLQARETLLNAREQELAALKGKYAELLDKGSSNPEVLTELANVRLENEFHRTRLLAREEYYQQLTVDLDRFRADATRLQQEKEGLASGLKGEQERRVALEKELAAIKGRVEFTATDLSNYLNHAIDSFNTQVNVAEAPVNYVISELDVDIKAGIGTTAASGVTMVAPSATQLSEQGLSSFKFTIRAVPRPPENQ